MHHDYLMIATHLGTELGPLVRSMNAHSEITLNRKPLTYTTPPDLRALKSVCGKYKESRIYADVVSYNHSLRSPAFADICQFIYYLGDPRRTLTSLIQKFNYPADKAYDYYLFRMQRLVSMAAKTKKAILLTWDELHNDNLENNVKQFLRLKAPLYFSIEGEDLRHPPAEGGITNKFCHVYDRGLQKIQLALRGHCHVDTTHRDQKAVPNSPQE